ncbi:hypothetical protein [Rossellomorea sp. DUT-2]|uniref:hypothetical protein n=1 Tax=Rossellomorea sp. DUT-2 TaxID=3412021 RepID=UPI003D17CA06
MAKHGEGLGYEIVKGVLAGEIIEPITYEKVKMFCEDKGIEATVSDMRVILPNDSHSPTYKKYFSRVKAWTKQKRELWLTSLVSQSSLFSLT